MLHQIPGLEDVDLHKESKLEEEATKIHQSTAPADLEVQLITGQFKDPELVAILKSKLKLNFEPLNYSKFYKYTSEVLRNVFNVQFSDVSADKHDKQFTLEAERHVRSLRRKAHSGSPAFISRRLSRSGLMTFDAKDSDLPSPSVSHESSPSQGLLFSSSPTASLTDVQNKVTNDQQRSFVS